MLQALAGQARPGLRRHVQAAVDGDHHGDGGAGAGLRDEPSGQTATLGDWLAGAGGAFAILSPILGWLGVAVTGSDTSSNSLFGALQVQTAASKAGLDPVLMAAANSSGGVLGKMVSPQNLAIAAAAVGMAGREGDIFRKVIGWSLFMLAIMC